MTIPPKKVINADAGDADHVGGNDWDELSDWVGAILGATQYDYIIYKSGSNIIAYNTATGANQYSSTDARTTFNNVSDAMNSAGGGSCFIKKGTYTMAATAANITARDNCAWIGEDRDLTILVNASTTNTMFIRIGGPLVNFKLRNLKFTSAGAEAFLYAAGTTDCVLENCIFEFTAAPSSGHILTFFDDVSDTRSHDRLIVRNCKYIGDCATQDMLGCGHFNGCDITNNVFMNNTNGQGIGVGSCTATRWNNNFFFNLGGNGIGFESLDVISNVIVGNTFLCCNLYGVKLSQLGTSNNFSYGNVVSGNIVAYGKRGVEDGRGESDIISNNVFRRLSEWAVRGTFSGCIIENNIFDDVNYNNTSKSIGGITRTCGGV